MATHSSVLAWRTPRMGEPGGLPSMGSHKVEHDWSDLAAVAAAYILLFILNFGSEIHIIKKIILCKQNWQMFSYYKFSSVTQSCLTLGNPMNHSTPGLPVYYQLLEFTQIHVHWVDDAIQPSNPLYSLLLLPPIPPSIRVFSNESALASGDQSIGVSALASFLPMNTQTWSPLEWTGWISLQSKGLSRVFSSTTVQKHQLFSSQPSSQSNSHIHTWPQEKP